MSDYAVHRLLIPIYVQVVNASRGFMLRKQHSGYAVTEWLTFRSKLKFHIKKQ